MREKASLWILLGFSHNTNIEFRVSEKALNSVNLNLLSFIPLRGTNDDRWMKNLCSKVVAISQCNLGRGATHVLGLQQLLAALVAVGMRYHFGVDTGVVSAGQYCHGHGGIKCPFQLPCNLCDLLMSTSAEKDLWDLFPPASLFVFLVVLGLFNQFLSCFEVGTRTARTRHGRLPDTKRERKTSQA